jgi:hypothetical protein
VKIPVYFLEGNRPLHDVPSDLTAHIHSPLGPFEIPKLLLGPVLCLEHLELSDHSRSSLDDDWVRLPLRPIAASDRLVLA